MTNDPKRKPLSLLEAVEKRPGMYVGDLGRLGSARLIAALIEILVRISINNDWQEGRGGYSYHAFLDVTLNSNTASLLIDFNNADAPDYLNRAETLGTKIEARSFVEEKDWPLVLGTALTLGLRLNAGTTDLLYAIYPNRRSNPAHAAPVLQKDSFVAVEFAISEALNCFEMTEEYLTGFLEAKCEKWAGLVLRTVSVTPGTLHN